MGLEVSTATNVGCSTVASNISEKVIGEVWDFMFDERRVKVAKMIAEYERQRLLKHKLGIAIDEWEAKK
jgi:hypothetical protein